MRLACAVVGLVAGAQDGSSSSSRHDDYGMDIVREFGYPLERHPLTTSDGYILGLYRMRRDGRPPVLLQHGLEDSSPLPFPGVFRFPALWVPATFVLFLRRCVGFAWVANAPNESLAYLLYDAGYDVWLGNNRGTKHSRAHTAGVRHFWDFSYDEMARFDWPETVREIVRVTAFAKIGSVGHSEGTMQAFAALAEDAQNTTTRHVALLAALAPVAYVGALRGPLRILAEMRVDEATRVMGVRDFLDGALINRLCPALCARRPSLCDRLVGGFVGPSTHLNTSRFDIYVAATPEGSSVKNIVHFGQGVRFEHFAAFDYGAPANLLRYGSTSPPVYDLAKVDVPVALFSGGADYLAAPVDVERLASELPPNRLVFRAQEPTFAHLDFTWAPDAADRIYRSLLGLLQGHLPIDASKHTTKPTTKRR